jgi:hypothetical protein
MDSILVVVTLLVIVIIILLTIYSIKRYKTVKTVVESDVADTGESVGDDSEPFSGVDGGDESVGDGVYTTNSQSQEQSQGYTTNSQSQVQSQGYIPVQPSGKPLVDIHKFNQPAVTTKISYTQFIGKISTPTAQQTIPTTAKVIELNDVAQLKLTPTKQNSKLPPVVDLSVANDGHVDDGHVDLSVDDVEHVDDDVDDEPADANNDDEPADANNDDEPADANNDDEPADANNDVDSDVEVEEPTEIPPEDDQQSPDPTTNTDDKNESVDVIF